MPNLNKDRTQAQLAGSVALALKSARLLRMQSRASTSASAHGRDLHIAHAPSEHLSIETLIALVRQSQRLLSNPPLTSRIAADSSLADEGGGGGDTGQSFSSSDGDAPPQQQTEQAQNDSASSGKSYMDTTSGNSSGTAESTSSSGSSDDSSDDLGKSDSEVQVRSEAFSPTTEPPKPGIDQKSMNASATPGLSGNVSEHFVDPHSTALPDQVSKGAPQETGLKSIAALGEAAGYVIDSTAMALEAAKAAGMRPNGAPGSLGLISTVISASNAYDNSTGVGDFVYNVGKDAASGYAGAVAGSAASGALQGSAIGPWGAAAVGAGAGIATAISLSNADTIVKAVVGYGSSQLNEAYLYLNYEITALYLGRGR